MFNEIKEFKSIHSMQQLITLPQPLLEMILVTVADIKDKKALRQTCKLFKQALDCRMTHIRMYIRDGRDQQDQERLLQCMQHLQDICLLTFCNTDSLLKHLPGNLRRLTIHGCTDLDLEQLSRLLRLTSLDLSVTGKVTGLQAISGLTSLHCYKACGSLAHLAPTLKHLHIMGYDALLQMDKLTNLESLQVSCDIPSNFLQKHSILPLKRLLLGHPCEGFVENAAAWQAAPTTLTRLTLSNASDKLPDTLPVTITHLQLLHPADHAVDQALSALTALRSLDIAMFEHEQHDWGRAFGNLSKHSNLQSLCLAIRDYMGRSWQRDQIISELPNVSKAVERGVRLNVIKDQEEYSAVFHDLQDDPQSAWATQA